MTAKYLRPGLDPDTLERIQDGARDMLPSVFTASDCRNILRVIGEEVPEGRLVGGVESRG